MASAKRTASAVLLTAAAMYWLDPTSGRRRRALLKDRVTSTMRRARHAVGVGTRDLTHRTEGFAAQARHAFAESAADDGILGERVRTSLGRAVSHPGAIEIEVSDGHLVLKGDVLAREHPPLIDCVQGVRGLKSIEDQLAVHEDARGVSSLQGGRPRTPGRLDILQMNWSPATRLLMTAVGGVLAMAGLRRGGALGMCAAAAGGLSIARSTANVPLSRLVDISGERSIHVRKTLHIRAPVDQVFQALSQFERYPIFMHSVRSVRRRSDGHYHWTAAGPGGLTIGWDAEISAFEPNRLIAWRTGRNSGIRHRGIMRFGPCDSGTRLELKMSYHPPAGATGHIIARLFGADPKTQLDQALLRTKTFIETGRLPRDAALHAPAEMSPRATTAESPNMAGGDSGTETRPLS